jgi:ubiquinone/menaquinone biosynthesis C-methylase UbiE
MGGVAMHQLDAHGGHDLVATALFGGRRRRVYRRLAALTGARAGDRVLDVGCGTGYFTRMLARAVAPGGTARGVDPSEQAIGKAQWRNRSANCTFDTGVAQHLDAPDGGYDAVVTTLAMHHVPAQDRAAALAEMRRVLRPGGLLLVAEFRPPRSRTVGRLVRAHSPVMAEIRLDELESLVRAAGFENLRSGDLRPWIRYVLAGRPA